jgi:hypothetical protein
LDLDQGVSIQINKNHPALSLHVKAPCLDRSLGIRFHVSFLQIFFLQRCFICSAMTLVLIPEPVSIQRLLAPLLAIDRNLQEPRDILYDLQDMEDDLTDWDVLSPVAPLRQATSRIRLVLTELETHKLRIKVSVPKSTKALIWFFRPFQLWRVWCQILSHLCCLIWWKPMSFGLALEQLPLRLNLTASAWLRFAGKTRCRTWWRTWNIMPALRAVLSRSFWS